MSIRDNSTRRILNYESHIIRNASIYRKPYLGLISAWKLNSKGNRVSNLTVPKPRLIALSDRSKRKVQLVFIFLCIICIIISGIFVFCIQILIKKYYISKNEDNSDEDKIIDDIKNKDD
jgi:hypothetical protein